MSNNTESPNVNSGEQNVPDNLAEQSGLPNMSSTKPFTVQTDLIVEGDVYANAFIGDGSQLTGISGGGGGTYATLVGYNPADPSDLTSIVLDAKDGIDPATFRGDIINDSGSVIVDVSSPSATFSGTLLGTVAGNSTTPDGGVVVLDVGTDGTDGTLTITDITADGTVDFTGATVTGIPSGGLDSAAVQSLIDADLIGSGINSVAVGLNTVASTNSTVAIGYHADALGDQSVSIGENAYAGGINSVVMGHDANNSPAGNATVAIGFNAHADAYSTISIGQNANATGSSAIAIGEGASTPSADNTVAVGINAEAAADYAVSIGDNATVSNPAVIGIAIGRNTSVTTPGGVGGVAIGSGASVSDNDTLAIGRNTVASAADATAIGPNTTASGLRSIAIGNNVTAITDDAVTIGSSVAGRVTYDTTNDWTFGATVNAPAFVGDGSGLTNLPSGGGLDSAATIALIGMQNKPAGNNAIQITPDTTTLNGDNNNIIIGTQISDMAGIGPQAVAMGYDIGAQANGVSIGYQAGAGSQSTNNGGVFIGSRTNYFGNSNPADYAIAIGHEAGAVYPGVGSVALGKSAGAGSSGDYTVAVGYNANNTSSFNNTIMIKADGSSAHNSTAQYDIDIRTSAAGSLTYDTTNDWTFGAGVTMTDLTASGATVVLNNLPTVDPVNAGQLWNDGGTLKVSAG